LPARFMHSGCIMPQLTFIDSGNPAQSSLGEDAAIIVDKSSSIYLKFQFKLSRQDFTRIRIIFQIQLNCLLHVILNLLYVIAYSNNGSTFDISTQVLRSEERRVGKECRCRRAGVDEKKNKEERVEGQCEGSKTAAA